MQCLPRQPMNVEAYFGSMFDIDYSGIDINNPAAFYLLQFDPTNCLPWSFIPNSGGGFLDCTSVMLCPGIQAIVTSVGDKQDIITAQEEGVNVCSNFDTINFTGTGVTATCVGGVLTVDITGSGITDCTAVEACVEAGDYVITGDRTFLGDVTYTGGTLTYNNVTQNFLNTPVLISCELGALFFAIPYVAPLTTQYADITITFDNGPDPADTQTVSTLINGVTQVLSFTSGTDTGTVQIARALGSVTVTILTGTPGFFTLDEICYFNGVSVNNYSNKIHIYNGDIFEYSGVSQVFNNSYTYYDSTSTFINEGDTILNNLNVTNINITGSVIGANTAHIEHFIATAGQTIFTLAFTPASNNFVRVSMSTGAYGKQDPIYDYTVAGNIVTLNNPASVGDVISVQYVQSLGSNVVINNTYTRFLLFN